MAEIFYHDSERLRYADTTPIVQRDILQKAFTKNKHIEHKQLEKKLFEESVVMAEFKILITQINLAGIFIKQQEKTSEEARYEETKRQQAETNSQLIAASRQSAEKTLLNPANTAPTLERIQSLMTELNKACDVLMTKYKEEHAIWQKTVWEPKALELSKTFAATVFSTAHIVAAAELKKGRNPDQQEKLAARLARIENAIDKFKDDKTLLKLQEELAEIIPLAPELALDAVPGTKLDFDQHYAALRKEGKSDSEAYCAAIIETTQHGVTLNRQLEAAGSLFKFYSHLNNLALKATNNEAPLFDLFQKDGGITRVKLATTYANSQEFRDATKAYFKALVEATCSVDGKPAPQVKMKELYRLQANMAECLKQAEHNLKKSEIVPSQQPDKLLDTVAKTVNSLERAAVQVRADLSIPEAPAITPGKHY